MENAARTSLIPVFAAALIVAALAALAAAAAAEAATKTVRDPRFDTPYLSEHGRLDITKATAKRRRARVRHSIAMRAKVRPARSRERPSIVLNTRGGRRSDYEFIVFGSTVFRVPAKGRPKPVGDATLTSKRRTWRYRFNVNRVPGLGAGYGWAAITTKRGNKLADVAPGNGYANSP